MRDSIVALAQSYVGCAQYKIGCDPKLAPAVFDCSTFTQYIFSRLNIPLPRFSYQQWEVCNVHCEISYAAPGDLVFGKGCYVRKEQCPIIAIGHVGILTNSRTVIHATYKRGVAEDPVSFFEEKTNLPSCLCAGSVIKWSKK